MTTSSSTKAIEDEAHAAAVFLIQLSKTDKDGKTAAEKAEFLESTGIKVSALDGPSMPPEVVHIWQWFLDLNGGRGGGWGPGPITWADIHGYCYLQGIKPHPWELSVLRAFDAAWLIVNNEKAETDG